MRVKIEFKIDSKMDLLFGQIIQSIAGLFKGFGIKWKYTVDRMDELEELDEK